MMLESQIHDNMYVAISSMLLLISYEIYLCLSILFISANVGTRSETNFAEKDMTPPRLLSRRHFNRAHSPLPHPVLAQALVLTKRLDPPPPPRAKQPMADAAELVRLLRLRAAPRPSPPQRSGPPPRPQPPRLLRGLPCRRPPPLSLRCRALDASGPAAVEGERGEEDVFEDEEESYFSVTSSGLSQVDYLGQSTRGDLNVRRERLEALGELQSP
jgi:hypothetical protein